MNVLVIICTVLFCMSNVFAMGDVQMIDLDIIAEIESSNNPTAYNEGSKATGMYQITPIALKDFNTMTKSDYTLEDMYDVGKAHAVSNWMFHIRSPQLLKHYGYDDTVENRIRTYSQGIGSMNKGNYPPETKNYVAKYERIRNDKTR